ncbi:MAG: polyphosphate polymerase domain-containing protein [Putridiphycobacter sp.]
MVNKAYIEKEIISSFDPISLSEMDEVKLMNRTDTKFVIERELFNRLLPDLKKDYKALEILGNRINNYETLYFDEPNFQFFIDHHNGKGNRFKVRIRNYVESKLYFLEIKNKFKGRTDKKRIKVQDFELELSKKSSEFIKNIVGENVELESKLWNSFGRMTLVNKNLEERLTLDLNLTFKWHNKEVVYDHVVIAELKQGQVNRSSAFYDLMKKNEIRPYSISKYCVGAVSLNPNLKYNNFKEKLLLIEKLK